MLPFAQLYRAIDSTTKTRRKVEAMADYFRSASPQDSAWAAFLLSGRKIRQLVPTKRLRIWAAEAAAIPDWLFEECYSAVGDLAETLSLVIPPGHLSDSPEEGSSPLTHWIEDRLIPLQSLEEADQHEAVLRLWRETPIEVRFVAMKIITGAFRVGVSARLVTRAIADASGLPPEVIAHRLMGDWQPTEAFFRGVVDPDCVTARVSQPYPFCLANPLDGSDVEALGCATEFAAEWKWDGIRGQLIRRQGQTFLWSRGEELMQGRWPEIEAAAESLPDGTVLDGEILAVGEDGAVLPFAELQRRIGRKTISRKLLSEVPVRFFAFDLLEHAGEDLRDTAWSQRRAQLEELLATFPDDRLVVNELLSGESWEDWSRLRQTSRERGAEGLMIKRKEATYGVGRVRGVWWKWKVQPYTIDAVLIYAQRGHGKRASLYTDYTFAVWRGEELVPFAKAYSGLDDAEIRAVDRFVRRHTEQAFGPVRSVKPELVMELAFEGLQRSTRHKSGVATRFPRIVRWRHDKAPRDANTLDELLALLPKPKGANDEP